MQRDPGEPIIDKLLEVTTVLIGFGCPLEVYVVLVVWEVYNESVPQPRGVVFVVFCWSTGGENLQMLSTHIGRARNRILS